AGLPGLAAPGSVARPSLSRAARRKPIAVGFLEHRRLLPGGLDLLRLNDVAALVAPGVALVGHHGRDVRVAEQASEGEHGGIRDAVEHDVDVVLDRAELNYAVFQKAPLLERSGQGLGPLERSAGDQRRVDAGKAHAADLMATGTGVVVDLLAPRHQLIHGRGGRSGLLARCSAATCAGQCNHGQQRRPGQAEPALNPGSTALGVHPAYRVLVRTSHVTSPFRPLVAGHPQEPPRADWLRPMIMSLRLAPALGPTVAM